MSKCGIYAAFMFFSLLFSVSSHAYRAELAPLLNRMGRYEEFDEDGIIKAKGDCWVQLKQMKDTKGKLFTMLLMIQRSYTGSSVPTFRFSDASLVEDLRGVKVYQSTWKGLHNGESYLCGKIPSVTFSQRVILSPDTVSLKLKATCMNGQVVKINRCVFDKTIRQDQQMRQF